MEGGTHSSTRKALQAGATKDEIRQTALLSTTSGVAVTSVVGAESTSARAWTSSVISMNPWIPRSTGPIQFLDYALRRRLSS